MHDESILLITYLTCYTYFLVSIEFSETTTIILILNFCVRMQLYVDHIIKKYSRPLK